jgi:AcrR family transcriptional regulator
MSSQSDPQARLRTAAQRLAGAFHLEQLAHEAGLSRATVYRHLSRRPTLRSELRTLGLEPTPSSRAQILSATARVIEEHGLDRLTIEEVARSARVSAVTVYRQFKNRDGLLRAFMQSIPSAATATTLDPAIPLEEALAQIAEVAITRLEQNRGLVRAALAASPALFKKLARVRNATEGTRSLLAATFRARQRSGELGKTIDPVVAADAFAAALLMPVLMPSRKPTTVQRRARHLARLFTRGLQP